MVGGFQQTTSNGSSVYMSWRHHETSCTYGASLKWPLWCNKSQVVDRMPWHNSYLANCLLEKLPSLTVRRLQNALCLGSVLTHWGRVTHICVSNLTTIGSDNGLSPGRCQAIIWTNAGILLIGPLGTNFNEILIEIHIFSFKKIHFKMSSGKWRPFCLGLNVLTPWALGKMTEFYRLRVILCMRSTNERRRYNVTSSLIGWTHR